MPMKKWKANDLESAKMRIDNIFKEYPRSASSWMNKIQFKGLNTDQPVAYAGLRMLEQIVAKPFPPTRGYLNMTVVIAPYAEVHRPTLPDHEIEKVKININPQLFENNYERLYLSTELFRNWVQSITNGLEIKLNFHILDQGTTVTHRDDGKIVNSYPKIGAMIEAVPMEITSKTDMWWVIAPSGVPGDGSGFNRHFITGGMTKQLGMPTFISDDAWFIRKPEHLGKGPYSYLELKVYQPHWFQHEFMHHLYGKWPEMGLEKKISHVVRPYSLAKRFCR